VRTVCSGYTNFFTHFVKSGFAHLFSWRFSRFLSAPSSATSSYLVPENSVWSGRGAGFGRAITGSWIFWRSLSHKKLGCGKKCPLTASLYSSLAEPERMFCGDGRLYHMKIKKGGNTLPMTGMRISFLYPWRALFLHPSSETGHSAV
jgi:hypothetical protein